MPYISVITPVYGCKTCLYELYFRLKQTLETLNPDFEIIMVNDASPDGAWETIVELAQKDKRVKYLDEIYKQNVQLKRLLFDINIAKLLLACLYLAEGGKKTKGDGCVAASQQG